MSYFLILLSLVASLVSAGQVNICTDDSGKKSFQDRPCDSSDKSEVRDYGKASASSGLLSGDWVFYKEEEFMKSDSFCALRSKEIAIPSDYGRAAVSFAIYKTGSSYSVALVSMKKGVGNPDVFDSQFVPSVMLGDSGPWLFSRIDGGVSHLGFDDSKKFIAFFQDGGGDIKLKVTFWPSRTEKRVSYSLSGYKNMLSSLDDC